MTKSKKLWRVMALKRKDFLSVLWIQDFFFIILPVVSYNTIIGFKCSPAVVTLVICNYKKQKQNLLEYKIDLMKNKTIHWMYKFRLILPCFFNIFFLIDLESSSIGTFLLAISSNEVSICNKSFSICIWASLKVYFPLWSCIVMI